MMCVQPLAEPAIQTDALPHALPAGKVALGCKRPLKRGTNGVHRAGMGAPRVTRAAQVQQSDKARAKAQEKVSAILQQVADTLDKYGYAVCDNFIPERKRGDAPPA